MSQWTRLIVLALAFGAILAPQAQAQSAPWVFGLGTGFSLLNTEGTQGFNTTAFGPVESDYELSPSDVNDLLETGFGFGAMATNGSWTVNAGFSKIKLGGDVMGTLDAGFGGFDYTAEAFFEVSSGEFSVGNTVHRSQGGGFAVTPFVGVRTTKHELGLDLTVMDGIPSMVTRGTDHSWTDFLVGSAFDVTLSPTLSWNTNVNGGFGGSEGTYSVATGLAWSPAAHWVISPNASFTAVEFENGVRGDSDWYFYDSNDTTFGLAVMYLFF